MMVKDGGLDMMAGSMRGQMNETLPEGSALCSLAVCEGRSDQIRWRGHAEDKRNAESKKEQKEKKKPQIQKHTVWMK